MKLAAGQRARIVETFEVGTQITYEGILETDTDTSEYGATATFLGGATAWAADHRDVKVRVEPVAPPLPEALGSVIRYYYAGAHNTKEYQTQMRVIPERSPHAPDLELGWVTADGSRVADPTPNGYWEVIHDAAG